MVSSRNELLPFLAMVIVQIAYAGMNITSKVALESGMAPLVLVVYRQVFATLAIAPFAYFLEREKRPKITKKILFQIFLCSLFGATLNQIFYFVGLKATTATIACALNNMLPAMTFLLAIPLGLETVGIKTMGGQAKIIGTIVCIGGAMLLSFYHGHLIDIHQPDFHWHFAGNGSANTNTNGSSSHLSALLGPILLLASNLAMAIWFVIQAKMSEDFSAPYTSSALMGFMGSIQCIIIAACTNHQLSDWSLSSPIRLVAGLYAGVVGSGVAVCLMAWTIQVKGPLYVSVFSPLLLVIVALLSWALRMEKLYIGTAIGSVLIVLGLYAVLWGKNKEILNVSNETDIASIIYEDDKDDQAEKEDVEKQQQLVIIKAKFGDHLELII
ncbi:WAT1-related protein At1g09380-like [Chenopodium quinoa]|uniref:WAT1-related protein At1g09380-like n=1 Tax=Chenopodium quinoa TaxID=63459 RepID=UPI000B79A2D6|nr:WAT1-related protein At1g09380-like [Chenopodium quinoa]